VNGAGVKISPVAVHAEGDGHETPLKKSPCPSVPGGVGADWTVHVVPSHRSASSPEAVLPTAVHALGEVHETAFRKAPGLAEVGVGWMRQIVPSHRSVTVPTLLPELSKAPPTAVQANCDAQETPVRKLNCVPGGLGMDWTVHVVPSHRSASSPEAVLPTAVHALGEVHETAFRKAPGLAEVGVGWMRQVVPSHRSVIVPAELPELSKATPTAMHITGDVHATPFRPLPAAPAGLGVGVMRHAVPSHRSARVPPVDCPTDMQDTVETQATPRSCAPRAPSGLAVGWTLH
jgi:hypothetical protein